VAESLRWVTQLMSTAETRGPRSPDSRAQRRIERPFWLGDPIKSREHAYWELALYRCEAIEPRHQLGYPGQAVKISDAALDHARRRGHHLARG
jgi:hypothetical protein